MIGVPLYNAARHLGEALDGLLGQTYRDVAFVCIDDGSTDETEQIARRYAGRDPRLTYERNARRLGLTGNWRRAFERATALYPDAEFFAWGSDHDVWHPRWLERLIRRLESRPDAVLAYARDARLEEGRIHPRAPSVDTTGLGSVRQRFFVLSRRARAGQMIYGLFRTDAVRQAGGFRDVLYADRLLIVEAALLGELVEEPEILWYKRQTGTFSAARQRAACFPYGPPLHSRLPWWVAHSAMLLRSQAARSQGDPLAAATTYLLATATQAARARIDRLTRPFTLKRRRQRRVARLERWTQRWESLARSKGSSGKAAR